MFGSGLFGGGLFGAAGGGGSAGPTPYSPEVPLRVIVRAGQIVAPVAVLQIKVFAQYSPAVALTVDVHRPRYAPAAPLKVTVFGRYAPVVPLAVSVSAAVAAPAVGAAPMVWSARVLVGGVDVSARLTGQISVEAEENAARVARVSLAPAGVVVALAGLAAAPVAIDLELWDAAGAARIGLHRLFTGVVDTPDYDPVRRVITLTCSDARQAKIRAMAREQIDAITPDAAWSPHVFDRYAKAEQYLSDRLSTLAGCVDGDAWGALGYTPWAGNPTRVFGDDQILDGSLAARTAGGASVRRTRLTVTYRHPQAVVRGIGFRYEAPELSVQYYKGIRALTRNAVEQALQGSGATIVGGINWIDFPTKVAIDGGVGYVVTSPADAKALCMGGSAWLNRRYSRWIDEQWTVEIGTDGTLGEESRVISVEWDATESDTRQPAPTGAVTAFSTVQKAQPIPYIDPLAIAGERRVDYVPPGQPDGAAFAVAFEALVRAAAKSVAESRRGSSISFSVLIDPSVTLRNFVSVDAAAVGGAGKVSRVVHRMDIDAGSAVTEVEVQCSAVALPAVSAPVRQAIPAAIKPGAVSTQAFTWIGGMVESRPWDETLMFGFSTNVAAPAPGMPIYPEQFSVFVPGVEDAAQGTVAVPPVCTMRAGYDVLEDVSSLDGFAVGVKITGEGIPANATITAFDSQSRTVTISAPATASGAEREIRVETRQYIKRLAVSYAPTITTTGPNVGA